MFAKVLFDQFTAEKAANGWLREPLREVLLIVNQASWPVGPVHCSAMVKIRRQWDFSSPFRCLIALCFQPPSSLQHAIVSKVFLLMTCFQTSHIPLF